MELVGACVEVHSLNGRPELNGSTGQCVGYNQSKSRCKVCLDDPSLAPDGLLIKPANLNVMQPTAGTYSAFEAGASVADHTTGAQLRVQHDRGELVEAISRGSHLKLPRSQLSLVAYPDGRWASGYDVIRSSPIVSSIDKCDVLARMLSISTPPELGAMAWASFRETAYRCSSPTIEGLVSHPTVAWRVPDDQPAATNRIVFFALDAVAHHLVMEWEQALDGWRVLQSYMRHEHMGSGYTAQEWIGSARCGSIAGTAHRTFGQGRVLGRDEAARFIGLLVHLREASDKLIQEVLLPQLGVESEPNSESKELLEEWFTLMQARVRNWASEKLCQAETCGATLLDCPGMAVQITLGEVFSPDLLFKIPRHEHDALNETYIAITGESLSAVHYLRMLNYYKCDHLRFSPTEQEIAAGMDPSTQQVKGWAIRCLMWS